MFLDPRFIAYARAGRPGPRDTGTHRRAAPPRHSSRSGVFGPGLIATAFVLLIAAGPAFAAWPYDPNANLPVCTATGHQDTLCMIPDGAGGAIVAWQDRRSGTNYDIYAQHLLSSGSVDPAWPANGFAVCDTLLDQMRPQMVSDGAGGAIVTWQDQRRGNWNIFAQHILADGTADPAWPAYGVAVCTHLLDQRFPAIETDGAGGAIVTWQDNRYAGLYGYDIFAQRVRSAGVVAWPSNGIELCSNSYDQTYPVIAPDGSGGAIVAWQDVRTNSNWDIYAQRVDSTGTRAGGWAPQGMPVSIPTGHQTAPLIMPAGTGGAVIAWADARTATNAVYAQRVNGDGGVAWTTNGVSVSGTVARFEPQMVTDGAGGAIVALQFNYEIYAQRLLANGTTAWPTNGGIVVCGATGAQWVPQIATDGAGGAIIAWKDGRGGATYDVYAQHVQASGVVDPVWPVNGRAVCTAPYDQLDPQIVADDEGGAVMGWQDYRTNSHWNVYAQRVEPFGKLGNPEAVILAVEDNANDQGGLVHVAWSPSYLDAAPAFEARSYSVWRQVGPYWEFLGTVPARGYAGYSFPAATLGDAVEGSTPYTTFRVGARDSLGRTFWYSHPDSGYSVDNLAPAAPAALTGSYSEGVTTLRWSPNREPDLAVYRLYRGVTADFVPGSRNVVGESRETEYVDAAGAPYFHKLTAADVHGNESPAAFLEPDGVVGVEGASLPREVWLAAPAPNPVRDVATLRFALPAAGAVSLTIYDLSGRRVCELARGVLPAGEHERHWDGRDDAGHPARSGLYFVRLQAAGRLLTVRMVAVR